MPQLCECGCGEPAPIAQRTCRKTGRVKGQPQRFVRGHRVTHGRYRGARGAARARYGLTEAQYDVLAKEYGGRCPICGDEKPLVIDHDHETGEVRGLLCTFCNHSLEWAETHEAARKAYLERARCRD